MPELYRAEIQLPFRALGENDSEPLDPESPVILALIVARLRELGYQTETPITSRAWGNCATTKIGNELLVVQVDQLTFGERVNQYRVISYYVPKISLTRFLMRLIIRVEPRHEEKFDKFIDILDAEIAEILKSAGGVIIKSRRGNQVKELKYKL